MNKKADTVFCSLDIETSGFDPLTNEVLEVGFAFFTLTEKGIKITEEWTKVFKPKKEVPASILGLTGIKREELENGADFGEFKDFLQDKLGGAIIVGHNVVFDIKFLESCGLKFSGGVLDTLDLVQFILPTHHSYNLENLMHKFSVPHKDAHRALADCKATLSLMGKLLGVFQSFPEKLKKEVIKIAESGKLAWAELLKVSIPPFPLSTEQDLSPSLSFHEGDREVLGALKLENKQIYNFPVGKNCLNGLVASLGGQDKKVLLVLPKQAQVMALWKQGKAEAAFRPELLFNPKKFAVWQKITNFSPEETKFLLKILVWQETNWQTKTILDLNLSFFGGQFRNLISGSEEEKEPNAKIVCMDLATFASQSAKHLYKSRFVLIAGLSEFESAVSANISTKVSWGHIAYILKSFYNPEFNTGNLKFKDAVEQGLIAADLFFGIVNAFFQTSPPTFQYVKFTPGDFLQDKLQKIKSAAENFAGKLASISQTLKSESIAEFIKNLTGFFDNQDNQVKWAELAVGRCVLYSSPLDITGLVKQLLKPFPKVAFADSLGTEKLQNYFDARLGLSGFAPQPIIGQKKPTEQLALFGEKINKNKKAAASKKSGATKKIICYCQPRMLPYEAIAKIVKPESLPAAVLFGGTLQLKEFHQQNYESLKRGAFLYAQSQSGGSSKIFHNFSIHPNSLLLCTDKFVLRSITSLQALQPVESLAVKTLILCHLPFEQYTHPYQEALAAQFENPFEDFSLPRAVYNLHSILQLFNTPLLETFYIADAKLAKGYASVFKDYIKLIPNMELVEN